MSENENPIKFFAVLVDNEYAGVIGFPESDNMEAVLAGLNSNPTILPINIEQVNNVQVGFIWDGTKFVKPE